ncbi:MAG: hypothetical protein P8M73_03185 [Luminiphilus sp.]|nr:hypothetical protein [Luminiphilus sp.]
MKIGGSTLTQGSGRLRGRLSADEHSIGKWGLRGLTEYAKGLAQRASWQVSAHHGLSALAAA